MSILGNSIRNDEPFRENMMRPHYASQEMPTETAPECPPNGPGQVSWMFSIEPRVAVNLLYHS